MTHHIRPEVCCPKTNFYSYEQFELDTPVVGIALRFDSKSREIIVDLGDFTGIIPENEVCIGDFTYSRFSDIPYQISSVIGKKVRALVKGISDDGTILLSRKASMLEAWDNLEEVTILQAKITSIASFGIFIDIGNGITSYINKRDCSVTRYYDINKWFEIGDNTLIRIIEKNPVTFRISCSRKDAYPTVSESKTVNVGDFLAAKVGKSPFLEGGYYCEITPAITGIVDTQKEFEEGAMIPVKVKSLRKNGENIIGLKLALIE